MMKAKSSFEQRQDGVHPCVATTGIVPLIQRPEQKPLGQQTPCISDACMCSGGGQENLAQEPAIAEC